MTYGVIILTGVYLVLLVGMTLAQRKMLYHPCRLATPLLQKTAAGVRFQSWDNSAGKNIGWRRLSPTQPSEAQVLILHGNAGCALDWADYADQLQRLAAADVYILEYPGYADRPGSPTEESLCAAAKEGIELFDSQCQVYLIGESLGTGVATYLAGTFPERVSGVLLVAPFNNMRSVAQHHLPLFPVKWMLWDKYPSDVYLRSYRRPLGVVLGGRDTVIPSQFGRRLFDGYTGPKKLWERPEATHDDLPGPEPKFWEELLKFWQWPSRTRAKVL